MWNVTKTHTHTHKAPKLSNPRALPISMGPAVTTGAREKRVAVYQRAALISVRLATVKQTAHSRLQLFDFDSNLLVVRSTCAYVPSRVLPFSSGLSN